jgi:hypothetical protein
MALVDCKIGQDWRAIDREDPTALVVGLHVKFRGFEIVRCS